LYTTPHRTVPIIFPAILHIIVAAELEGMGDLTLCK